MNVIVDLKDYSQDFVSIMFHIAHAHQNGDSNAQKSSCPKCRRGPCFVILALQAFPVDKYVVSAEIWIPIPPEMYFTVQMSWLQEDSEMNEAVL